MENKKHPNCLIRWDGPDNIKLDIEYFKQQLKRSASRERKAKIRQQIKLLQDCVVIYKLERPYDFYTTKT